MGTRKGRGASSGGRPTNRPEAGRPEAGAEADRPDAGAEADRPEAASEAVPAPNPDHSGDSAGPRRGAPVSRRTLFAGAAGAAAFGAAAGAGGMSAFGSPTAQSAATGEDLVDLDATVPFYDQVHPAGVATPPQRYTVYMTFELSPTALTQDLQVLLARWTAGIAQLALGKSIGAIEPERPDAVATDTGEAEGLGPASLTVTVGLGPRIFSQDYGLADKKPALLADLPRIPGDTLHEEFTGGDLSLQACADDPQVAYHAIRVLARMVTGTAHTRWAVMGFGRASAGPGQTTPRNLMGFKDGTRNIVDDADYDRFVWLGEDAGWMSGGTYQVVRKIMMTIETWDFDRTSDQQMIFGRTKAEGAPLTGQAEFDKPDFSAADSAGDPVIDPTSHIALAAHENNDGVKILRRSYNFTDGMNPEGLLDAGLLFLSYQNDPEHFVTLQNKLGRFDLLNEYIRHVGSAIFAVPPAPATGGYIGQALFE